MPRKAERQGVQQLHHLVTPCQFGLGDLQSLTQLRILGLQAEDYKLSYSAQVKEAGRRKPSLVVPQTLYRMQRTEGELKGVGKDKIMVTCAKACWYAKGSDYLGRPGPFAQGSRLFDGVSWVPNTTRGTNDYQHCSHLIYLWDQHANVHVSRFLSVDDEHHRDLYAVSELLQWVWRSRVRKGEPITLFLPSARMRRLWSRWLDGELQGSGPVADHLI